MRAGVYLRISRDKTGEAAGVTRQQEDCIALADQLDWQVMEIYTDNDISASGGKTRPAYKRMVTDIETDRINAIITWHPDRLYRRMLDLEDLVETCEQHKIMVRTVRAGEFDLSTPTGKMIARILAATAQGEVEAKADRWLRSFRQRREAGRWMGSGPRTFGYSRDGHTIPSEAAVIRRIAERILDGDSVSQACRDLADRGITTTRGNPWEPTAMRVLLTNPRIAGLATIQGTIIGDGDWEPILDRVTWEKLRAHIEARRGRAGPGGNPRSLLNGIVVCGYPIGDDEDCGRTLTKTTKSVPVYQCRTGAMSSRHTMVSAQSLERMVEGYARAKWDDDRVRDAILATLRPGEPESLIAEITDAERELGELRLSLTSARHRETKNDIIAEMDRLRDVIAERRAHLLPLPDIPVVGNEWPESLEWRARMIRLMVARIVVTPAERRGTFDPGRVRIDPA